MKHVYLYKEENKMTREEKYMMEAIALSKKAIENNEGGPFGCIVVKGSEIIGRGNNKVILENDPTAHAEIVAIRNACEHLGTFQLSGCEIYTSCEPCPMCLALFIGQGLKEFFMLMPGKMPPVLALTIR